MSEFLEICEYFEITPSQFFDDSMEKPAMMRTAIEGLEKLDADDLLLTITNISRLNKDK